MTQDRAAEIADLYFDPNGPNEAEYHRDLVIQINAALEAQLAERELTVGEQDGILQEQRNIIRGQGYDISEAKAEVARLSGQLAERKMVASAMERYHAKRLEIEKAEVARLSSQLTAARARLLDLRRNLAASNRDAWEIVDRILADLSATSAASAWQPTETAPKDGTLVFLRSAQTGRCHLGQWDPEGTSWIDENGLLGRDCYMLAKTGVWESGGGWFQPNEVTHWAPIPPPPAPESARWQDGGADELDKHTLT